MSEQIFKKCPMCQAIWVTRESFLSDPDLQFNGYQPDFDLLRQGLFYFTHNTHGCGSTMILEVEHFLPLHSGEQYEESKRASDECLCLCQDQTNLNRCDASCKNAFAREVSQIIKNRFKHQAVT